MQREIIARQVFDDRPLDRCARDRGVPGAHRSGAQNHRSRPTFCFRCRGRVGTVVRFPRSRMHPPIPSRRRIASANFTMVPGLDRRKDEDGQLDRVGRGRFPTADPPASLKARSLRTRDLFERARKGSLRNSVRHRPWSRQAPRLVTRSARRLARGRFSLRSRARRRTGCGSPRLAPIPPRPPLITPEMRSGPCGRAAPYKSFDRISWQ